MAGMECGGAGTLAAPIRRFQHTLELALFTMLSGNVFLPVLLMRCWQGG